MLSKEQNRKLTILLIDDDNISHFVTKKNIQLTQFDVDMVSFKNGAEALGYMRDALTGQVTRPDVIFLDLNMPVMNGLQFLDAFEAIKHLYNPPVNIYVVSTSNNSTDLSSADFYHTVKGYLLKPVQQEQFSGIFRKMIKNIT